MSAEYRNLSRCALHRWQLRHAPETPGRRPGEPHMTSAGRSVRRRARAPWAPALSGRSGRGVIMVGDGRQRHTEPDERPHLRRRIEPQLAPGGVDPLAHGLEPEVQPHAVSIEGLLDHEAAAVVPHFTFEPAVAL